MNFEDVKKDALDVLQHHGILGMKWGVRRTPEQLGHVTNTSKSSNAVGEDTAKSKFIKTAPRNPENPDMPRDPKAFRSLTDDQFASVIRRLQLEDAYDKIINKDYNTAAEARAKSSQFWRDQRNRIIGDSISSAVKWLTNTGGQLATQAINKKIREKNQQDQQ